MPHLSYNQLHLSAFAFVFLLTASYGAVACGQQFSFSQVVDTGTLVPGSDDPFGFFRAPSIDNGRIAFVAGNGNFNRTGVYTSDGNGLEVVADIFGSGGVRAFNGATIRSNVSISGNEVAFFGGANATATSPSQFGIFARDVSTSGGLRNVVDTNTNVPGVSPADDFQTIGDFAISGGAVIFTGDDAAPPFPGGVYLEQNGALSVVADSNTPIPGTSQNFNNFTGVEIDGNNLFFSHITPNGQFVSSGGVIESVPSTIVSGNNFAILSSEGISLSIDGETSLVVTREDNASDPSRTFAIIQALSLDGDDVAFFATDTNLSPNREGLFAYIDGSLVTVVEEGDVLNGLTVSDVEFGGEGFRDGQIAFGVSFTDGSEAVFVATTAAVPEPTSLLALSGGALLICLRRRR